MSEVMNSENGRKNFRGLLLASVSTLALVCLSARNADADDNQPVFWIELGGTLDHVDASQTPYIPPFAAGPLLPFVTIAPASLQKPPGYSIGGEGTLSFQPDGTGWVFSASVRYGRGVSHKDVKQQEPFPTTGYKLVEPFFNAKTSGAESHIIVDFNAGKDVGLGMAGSSTLSLGVRYAQFGMKSIIRETFAPSVHISGCCYTSHFTSHVGIENAKRSFHGIGPSIAWTGSVPLIGHENDGELALDWGANAAILFGRQKADVSQRTAIYLYQGYDNSTTHPRARAVTVPNVGGFAGLSYRIQNAKVKLGYRADFFFGAMDGGIDTAKNENRGFYGPFATLSIGLGG